MRLSLATLAVCIWLAAGPVQAQTASPGTQPKVPAQRPATAAPLAPPAAAQSPTGAPPPTLEKPDPAKEAAIRHLMEITQTSKLGENISGAITQQVRAVMSRSIQQPDQMQKFMEAFTQKFQAAAPASAVTEAEIPIYSHYFTMEDIQGLIKFYESPLGQRVVKSLPEVVQSTQQAGVQMDQKAALDVLRSMSTEYPELKQMLPPEPGAPPPAGAAPSGTPPSGTPPSGGIPPAPGTPPR
jgi:uncharacterized protein